MGLHFVHRCRKVVTHLCFDLILPDSRLAENHRFCHAGVVYRSRFPSITKSWQNITEIGENRECDCVDLEKWLQRVEKLEDYAGPKSQNGKMNFNIHCIAVFKLHVAFKFYLCIAI